MAVAELFKGLVYTTIGLLLFTVMMTFGATVAGYFELRAAAEAAAWSAQSQIQQEVVNSSGVQGYFTTTLQTVGDPVQAAQQQFEASAQSEHLSNLFDNLQENAIVNNEEVTVTVSGTFHVPWIQEATQAIFGGAFTTDFQVPMTVSVTGGSA
ncbi:hypothetical protein [Alicyclobacillus acidocaldarius]|uniref:Uncharacterized protein n=1 Tax=Alicyclobacillus acidocaldarius (strain Tc-4-1) TaxID=1048834 RepID=F8IGM3_ALIAT|nr:hypothetical protein [Alicyclobacillus acidocaldarius]AEJ44303.1 hypothetical protein TC41_2403 [Alicyclobacillus acidocaldarius subsp. acidocaldarius Tc-4-1]